jgi:DNA-binding GntR family transcriptional regulator
MPEGARAMNETLPGEAAPSDRTVALAREILAAAATLGWAAGARLPEPRLATLCRVSRTPVRKALEHLERLGLAAVRIEGGYCLACDPSTLDVEAIVAGKAPFDPIYRTILAERFAGLLGDEVSITAIMERYGATRAAAGEVLEALRASGLVRRAVGHSWIFVAGLADESSYRESMDFRLLVEPAALLAPGFKPAPRIFSTLRRRHEAALAPGERAPSIAGLVELDTTFHEALADCSGNRFLKAAVRQHTALRRVDEYQLHAMRGHFIETLREHLGVLDAVEAGDQRLAADRLRAHLVASRDRQPSLEQARALAYRRLVRR